MLIERIEKLVKNTVQRPFWPAPKTVYSPQGQPYAGFNRRMMAAMVDTLILTLLMTPFNNLVMALVYGSVHIDPEALNQVVQSASGQAAMNQETLKLALNSGMLQAFVLLLQIQFTVLAVYSFAFWHFYSATPGKMLLGLRIVNAKTGADITDWQAFLRLFGYVISGIPLMLGFFAISWSRTRRGWHDYIAGTAVVIRVKSAPPAAARSDSPAP